MSSQSKIKISSNRSFGLVFFIVFFIVGLWPIINNEPIRNWSIIISIFFLVLGLMNSKILTPLNKLWFRFGIFLGAIIAPIVMAMIFFLVVTPIGFMVKIAGKDLLMQKYENKKKSYWINRDKSIGSMKRQF